MSKFKKCYEVTVINLSDGGLSNVTSEMISEVATEISDKLTKLCVKKNKELKVVIYSK